MEDFIFEQMFDDDNESMLNDSDDSMLDNSGLSDDDVEDDILGSASDSDLLDDYECDLGNDDDHSMLDMTFDSEKLAQVTSNEMPSFSRIFHSPRRNILSTRQNLDDDSVLSDSLPFSTSKDSVIEQVESVFDNIANSLNNGFTLSIMIRAKPSSMMNSRGRIRKTALRAISFPGKTPKEAWRFSISLTYNCLSDLTNSLAAVLIRILEIIHEALSKGNIVTKRWCGLSGDDILS